MTEPGRGERGRRGRRRSGRAGERDISRRTGPFRSQGSRAPRGAWIVAAALLVLALGPLRAGAQASAGDDGYRGRFLPETDFFDPLLADMKEPRFYGGIRSVDFEGPALPGGGEETINAGVTAFGGTFSVWELRRDERHGLQVGVFAGVFSQFNLDRPSADLINTDFTVGPMVTAGSGRWSARLRAFHQSSHLGDEFLINNAEVERRNLSFEAVDLVLAFEESVGRVHGRLYGGGGYVISTALGLDRGLAQWGAEVRGPGAAVGAETSVYPIVAGDFRSFDEHDWDTTASLKGGVEWGSPGREPAVRLLAVYLNGFMPFGQFFSNTQLSNVGAELQVRF